MLITQPIDRPAGNVPGAATDDEVAAPVEFSGKLRFGPCPAEGTSEALPWKVETRGEGYCLPGVVEVFSDPRLQGTYYVWNYSDIHIGGPTIYTNAFTITNDEGAWRGIPVVSFQGGLWTDTLVGEGEYEGLTAVAEVTMEGDTWNWDGWIIEGDVPPMPEEPSAIE